MIGIHLYKVSITHGKYIISADESAEVNDPHGFCKNRKQLRRSTNLVKREFCHSTMLCTSDNCIILGNKRKGSSTNNNEVRIISTSILCISVQTLDANLGYRVDTSGFHR